MTRSMTLSKPMTGNIYRIITVALLAFVGGCTSTLAYNPEHAGRLDSIPGAQLAGRAVVLTTDIDDNYVFVGNPTSFTGGASKISIPLGMITRELTRSAFQRVFRDGAVVSQDLDSISDYRVVIKTRPSNFSYAYNQLKNAGLLITPQVDISLAVEVSKDGSDVLFSNLYSSGTKDGDSYMMSGSPGERINKLTHEVLTELLNRAVSDIYYLLESENTDTGN
ncbi:MAG: hypothetical protein ACFHX7_14165 [Pseudomonadota bacterium]